jgi:chromate transporter
LLDHHRWHNDEPVESTVGLGRIAREWLRIGCIGFGGPPAHIALLRKLCVEREGWLSAEEFEDGVATTNLLPGPASTQLAIYCAWRLGGPAGALIGGACFIGPGLVVILGLSALFLASHPPLWVAGAAAGAGAAVPAVAAQAALSLAPASWRRASAGPAVGGPAVGGQATAGQATVSPASGGAIGLDRARHRWVAYLVIGAVVAALAGPYLVFALAACGLTELVVRTGGPARDSAGPRAIPGLPLALAAPFAALAAGTLLSVAWVAFKVGALSYGGGFVIIPLMQHDVVHTYHWMTGGQFLSAVALGQVTPGPVVQTVAVVGYAAAGVPGGLLASFVAFTPSFIFVLVGAPRFAALRRSQRVQAFLTGAGPAAIGAIAGSTIPLALALSHLWQAAVLGLALVALVVARRNVAVAIVGAAALGIIAALAGAPIGQAA